MYNEKNSNFIKYDRNKVEIACLDELVPQDHLVSKIDKTIDFSFFVCYNQSTEQIERKKGDLP